MTNMQEMLEKFAGYKKTNLRNGCESRSILWTVFRRFSYANSDDSSNRKFYLVKADIKNCFDTIDQTILLDILRTVLREVRFKPILIYSGQYALMLRCLMQENYTLLKYNTTINAPNRKISRQEIVVVKGHSEYQALREIDMLEITCNSRLY